MKKLTLVVLMVIAIISCKDDDEIVGTVNLEFKNNIETNSIVLNTGSYTNQSDETYTISELKYIISNIVLIKANDEEFTYPVTQSYFVINEEVATSKTLNLMNIPAGEYTKIRFGFGVDQSNYPLNEVANFVPTAEEQGMLWSWSAGYIFLKFEGSYTPQGGITSDFLLHIGSHGTALDNYKEITLDLNSALNVNGNTSTINITADIGKIFDDGVFAFSFATADNVQVDPVHAPIIADNVQTMFSIQN